MSKRYLILIISVIFYLFIMNHLPSFEESGLFFNGSKDPLVGVDEEVGVSDKYYFSIKRPRIYGTIYENDQNSNLKFMNLVNIPLKKEKFSLIPFHLFFVFIILLYIAYTEKNKKVSAYY